MSQALKPAFSLPWQMTERLNHNDIPEVGIESVRDSDVVFVIDHALKEDRENTRYIVQACNAYPSLLEALEVCLNFCESYDGPDNSVRECIGEMRTAARAALKKARGESR